jgi:hypothetical protein
MTESIPILLGLNAIVCLVGVILCVITMLRQRRLLLLPATVLVFLATNGLLQGAQLWWDLGMLFPVSPLMFQRVLAVNTVVVICATIPLLAFANLRAVRIVEPPNVSLGMLTVLSIGCALSIGYFVARNSEIIPLSASLYRAADYFDYITIRNQIGDVVNAHSLSGSAPSNWAFAAICPAILTLLPYCKSLSARAKRGWFVSIVLLMAVPAVLIGSRIMLIFLLAFPILAVSMNSGRRRARRGARMATWKPIAASTAIGAVVFKLIVGGTLAQALASVVARSLVIPGAVSATYYVAFPGTFDFRGWRGVFMMPIAGDTVDFRSVSQTLLDLESNANAGFSAIAWSGAGLAGVLVACVVLVILTTSVDITLLSIPTRLASALVVANIMGILAVSSVPLLIAITTHGFALGPGLVLVLIRAFRRRQLAPRSLTPAAASELALQ